MALVHCQRDSEARSLDAEVLEVRAAGEAWRVRLSDTVLYPEGGGQPADHGSIAGVPVTDVRREGGEVWHTAAGPVALGPARVEVDWDRRRDLMEQHTGQHLLTAVARAELGLETVAFHLGAESSTVDLDGPLDEAGLLRLEAAVAREIRADRPVGWREADRSQLEALGVRTRGLPEELEGPVRLVEIAGLDLNTCGGTHVRSTGALRVLHLTGSERYKGGTRLRFLVGGRVEAHLASVRARTDALTRLLRQAPEAHPGEVERLLEASKAEARRRKALLGRLAELEGARLAAEPGTQVGASLAEADLGLLRRVAQLARADRTDRLVLLTGGDEAGSGGVFLLAGPAEQVAELGPRVAEALGGRGGGRGEVYQGQASRLTDPGALLAGLSSSS